MSINSIENSTRYSDELDKMLVQKSVTGFFADNTIAPKFVGAKTVIMPSLDFEGLADYDRDTGFSRGTITISNTPYTLTMDRARSLQIDREEMDESGVANLAGNILGEYVRTKVVPECDAYVLSKLSGLAISRDNYFEGGERDPMVTLNTLINNVANAADNDDEMVAFIDFNLYAKLLNASNVSSMITVSDFKQGDVNLKVKTINGVPLIPVTSQRMKTGYSFTQSGFAPLSNARGAYLIVCPKKAVHLIKKTEQMRIFTPEQNLEADAYKFDYRIYYDVVVSKAYLDTVWAWVSYSLENLEGPDDITCEKGNIEESLTVEGLDTEASLQFQWYQCDDANKKNAVKIHGATDGEYAIPENLSEGTYYYFLRIRIDDLTDCDTRVACVTVEPREEA